MRGVLDWLAELQKLDVGSWKGEKFAGRRVEGDVETARSHAGGHDHQVRVDGGPVTQLDPDLAVGPLGYNGSKAAMELIAKADVVLALGTRLNPFSTLPGYGIDYWPKDAAIIQVDINPEWVPPKSEEWAEDEETKAPGAADNPMGRARLVYRMPNTIHGTDDMASLGTATSHGSIRVANPVALKLAEVFLKAGGAWDGDQWFQQMVQNQLVQRAVADLRSKAKVE